VHRKDGAPRGPGRRLDAREIFGGKPEGLLAEDVEARGERLESQRRVQKRGRGDVDEIEAFLGGGSAGSDG